MFDVKSILTSKGQITVPKTIRDIMSLNEGDQVTFSIQQNNKVFMEKTIANTKNQALMNLVSLILNQHSPLTIKGEAGSGKTSFARKLLENRYKDQKIAIIEPLSKGEKGEYYQLKDSVNELKCFFANELKTDAIISEITNSNYDLVVVDEFYHIGSRLIKALTKLDIKLILISQVFEQQDMLNFGSHYSVTFNRNQISMEKNELINDDFVVTPIFID